jgi:hypothetical protein
MVGGKPAFFEISISSRLRSRVTRRSGGGSTCTNHHDAGQRTGFDILCLPCGDRFL